MYLVILVREIILFIEWIYEWEYIDRIFSSFFYTKSYRWILSHKEFTTNFSLYVFCNSSKLLCESISTCRSSEIYICIAFIFGYEHLSYWDNSIVVINILWPFCHMSTCYLSYDFLEAFLFYSHVFSIWKNTFNPNYKL